MDLISLARFFNSASVPFIPFKRVTPAPLRPLVSRNICTIFSESSLSELSMHLHLKRILLHRGQVLAPPVE